MLLHIGQTVSPHTALKYTCLAGSREIQSLFVQTVLLTLDRDNMKANIHALPMGTRFSARPDRPWGPPSLLYKGYRVFPGGRGGQGVGLTPHPMTRRRGNLQLQLMALCHSQVTLMKSTDINLQKPHIPVSFNTNLVISKCVTAVKVSNFTGHYLPNRSTLDIGVLGFFVII